MFRPPKTFIFHGFGVQRRIILVSRLALSFSPLIKRVRSDRTEPNHKKFDDSTRVCLSDELFWLGKVHDIF